VRLVFVDSGGFFALLSPDDHSHLRARELFSQALRVGWELITTNAVIFEAHALILNRVRDGRTVALRFLDHIEQGLCHMERVGLEDERRAIHLLRERPDKAYSLCDAASFMVMERLGVEEAIAFDRHFVQYGRFRILG
jgi:predicted nucleic acid-binding protein